MSDRPGEQVDLQTRGGHAIKVRADHRSCIVYMANRPEVVKLANGQERMEQTVPYVLFVGPALEASIEQGRLILVDVHRDRLAIPYRYAGTPRTLSVGTRTKADQFPVQVQHYPSVKEFMAKETSAHPYRFMAMDEAVPRIDLIALKSRNPDARMVIVRSEARAIRDAEAAVEVSSDRVRAVDLVQSNPRASEDAGSNPVFSARIFLRNLELDRVEGLLSDFDMDAQEIEFIRTFLKLMIRNDAGKPELTAHRSRLESIDHLFELSGKIANDDREAFEAQLDKGIPVEIRDRLAELIQRRRAGARRKADEIRFWEWQYRLEAAGR